MRAISLIFLGIFLGCEDGGATAEPTEDATPRPDGAEGVTDTGRADAGRADAGRADAARPDSGPDAARPDAARPDAAAPDAARPDAARPDAADPDAADPDAGGPTCRVAVRDAAGTLLGECVVPEGGPTCMDLAECLCMFPTPERGFGDCVTAITTPRALINLSDMCGVVMQSLGAVIRNPDWRGTWDEGAYRLTADAACDGITARF